MEPSVIGFQSLYVRICSWPPRNFLHPIPAFIRNPLQNTIVLLPSGNSLPLCKATSMMAIKIWDSPLHKILLNFSKIVMPRPPQWLKNPGCTDPLSLSTTSWNRKMSTSYNCMLDTYLSTRRTRTSPRNTRFGPFQRLYELYRSLNIFYPCGTNLRVSWRTSWKKKFK
jgi:hypothetical protein